MIDFVHILKQDQKFVPNLIKLISTKTLLDTEWNDLLSIGNDETNTLISTGGELYKFDETFLVLSHRIEKVFFCLRLFPSFGNIIILQRSYNFGLYKINHY